MVPVPEVAVLIGLHASGKTTFYRQHLAATHVHVSKDDFRNARDRERRQARLIAEALAAGRDVTVDNTNASPEERRPVIELARAHGASVIGYWFPPEVQEAYARNAERQGKARVPWFFATLKRLRPPGYEEGFDALYEVRLDGRGGFRVRPVAL
ncbi:kinase [Carbonactinospora thermoautotrophica]|uniref:Kinase n=1 Tax=Carbonactinospora thermoautotrophica TaxID=1469144 RepID=A0A132NHK4_9ACTN|nr:ATP-binding protein [Carbonactinospora thermoautotrophica]KWX05331.1 kinase [Carbonactinospora thermoautotrophica]KWX09611.1 kinase [Carbonactinospora thermoautotrophica]